LGLPTIATVKLIKHKFKNQINYLKILYVNNLSY
jgi:hypothetical protein